MLLLALKRVLSDVGNVGAPVRSKNEMRTRKRASERIQ